MVDNIQWLDQWYKENCDGEWEHFYGIQIDTLDNPGWYVKIDLRETKYECERSMMLLEEEDEQGWIVCKVCENQFVGSGDELKLDQILRVFREWIEGTLGV